MGMAIPQKRKSRSPADFSFLTKEKTRNTAISRLEMRSIWLTELTPFYLFFVIGVVLA